MSYRKIEAGKIVKASDMQLAIDQGVLVFGTEQERQAAMLTPTEGMHSYIKDKKVTQVFADNIWQNVGALRKNGLLRRQGDINLSNGTEYQIVWEEISPSEDLPELAWSADGGLVIDRPGMYFIRMRNSVSFDTGTAAATSVLMAKERIDGAAWISGTQTCIPIQAGMGIAQELVFTYERLKKHAKVELSAAAKFNYVGTFPGTCTLAYVSLYAYGPL